MPWETQRLIITGVAIFVIALTGGVLISQYSERSLFISMYDYTTCTDIVSRRTIYPVAINRTDEIVAVPCFHPKNHPHELEYGAPPKVSEALWVIVAVGFAVLTTALCVKGDD